MHTQNPSQSDLTTLLEHYENARYDLAYALATSITEQHPKHSFAWKILGALLRRAGNRSGALFANEMVVKLDPTDPEALYNLGNALKDLGKLEDAEVGYRNSIAIKPDLAEAHLNLGLTYQELGKLQDAEISYKNAIALRPIFIQAFNNLGNVQQELGCHADAVAQYEKAIELEPKYAEAHNNLGAALQKLKKLNTAEQSYKKAIALRSDFPEAHYNLGTLLKELSRHAEAQISFRQAIALKSDYPDAHYNLGLTLLETGDTASALEVLTDLIRIKPTQEAKSLFVDALKNFSPTSWSAELSNMVSAALLEPWGRPSDLVHFASQLLKLDPDFRKSLQQSEDVNSFNFPSKNFQSFALLIAILVSGPIPDRELEQYFTNLRLHLLSITLSAATSPTFEDKETFCCALAKQCFINEYIYYQTPEESELSITARDRLVVALNNNEAIPASLIQSVACYFPLHSLEQSEKLFKQNYSEELISVLKQQIQEPLEELVLRTGISCITRIDDQVSLVVQNQYEENPYPRWVSLPAKVNSKYFNSYISEKFPLAHFSPLKDDRHLEVLVAGCGTGQHSINCSQIIKGSKIFAIDLSMASLAYAKRKTFEMQICSIEYAQADLLKLSSSGRKFDVIESVGVLHHLHQPFKGWESLVSMLKPRGIMRLGFYSELARKHIVKARNLISQDHIGSSPQDIRNYRHHLLGLKNPEDFEYATSGIDFFSMSACRDLIFHVQEHRMRLDKIAEFLERHELRFLGFDIDRSLMQSYKRRFPDDSSATNLNYWDIYEQENPHTFNSMYQFLVQKN